ncbi:solute carrier family 2, facilitated glucose transporter member 8 [Electrophorus electricus]|uniref:Solute carrier family 2, facilitated glucose transporter member 8 n=1 Tax=Electrophorus electricus TaxID=8005 RepID=A0A4W4H726_ELEEL|nr:solute carrier family 2, facilitated glucose transporter member 8 [Electrophorus electricus]
MNHEEESRPLLAEENSVQTIEGRSEQDAYLEKVKNGKLFLATLAAVLGPLSFGFVLGYSSPAIPDLQRNSDERLRLTAEEASWFGSVVTIGAGLGGLLGGWVVERIGRKLTLMFCAMPFIFGFTIMIAAQNHWMLYVGRILTGLASGVTSLVVPLYISEMAHERVRGAVGSCVQLMVVTGIMGAYIAGLFQGWRWLAITCAIPPTVMLVFMCFMPETPRYLLTRGKRREAEEALRFLRGPHAPVEWECDRIEEASREEEGHFSLADLKDPGIYKPLGVGVMMMLLQQFTGINAIMFYAETIFEQAHFKNSDIATVVVAATQVVFTAVAALIMDRAGRKVLLILSGVAMCVSEVVFGIYFKLSTMEHGNSSLLKALSGTHGTVSETPPNDLTWLALASMGVFITGFALGWGPTPWLVMSEIFPMRARGFGSAVCVLTNWTCAFIVTKTFQNLMDLITSAGTFWMFSGLCALNVIFTIFFVPETKGKTLEEIQAHFKRTLYR